MDETSDALEEDSREEQPRLLSEDDFYQALAAQPRRRLLAYLLVHERSTVEELGGVLAGWDATESSGMATPGDHDQIVVALLHRHLPLLSEAGLVEYDRESGTVEVLSLDAAVVNLIHRSVASATSSHS
jgi:DNA-binding transcriptional ArsR family regulator